MSTANATVAELMNYGRIVGLFTLVYCIPGLVFVLALLRAEIKFNKFNLKPFTILVVNSLIVDLILLLLFIFYAAPCDLSMDTMFFPTDKDGYPVSLRRVEKITGKKITFYNVNTIDSAALEKIFDEHKIDCVMHFAALKSVAESVNIPLTYYSNNLTGTISLLEVMKKKGVKNFIFSSSCTVYGDPQKLPINEQHPTGQNIPTPYGKSKFMMEEILKDLWNAEKDWNVILLRYFNPVGAHSSGLIGEDPKGIPNNLMPYVSQVAVGKLPYVRVYGDDYDTVDGTGVRDYIHVVDLAKGHVVAIKQLEAKGSCKVFNLGTGHGYSVLQMIKALEKACGKEIPYKIEGRRPGDIATVFCDTTKATQEMGWKSELGLDEMCRDLWKWQSLNPQGFSV